MSQCHHGIARGTWVPCGAQLHAFSTVWKATTQILNNPCSPPALKANLYVRENMQGSQDTVESEIDKVLPSQTAQEKTIFFERHYQGAKW